MKMRLFALLVFSLALTSCHRNLFDEDEIRTNALGYMQAVGDYNFDDAIPYCTRHTRENTLVFFKYLLQHSDTSFVNSNRPSVFTIHRITQLDDTTASVYYHKSTPIKEFDDTLLVVYEDGQWLADVHLANVPYMSELKKGRKSVDEFPRHFTIYHPADSLTPEILHPSTPNTSKQ